MAIAASAPVLLVACVRVVAQPATQEVALISGAGIWHFRLSLHRWFGGFDQLEFMKRRCDGAGGWMHEEVGVGIGEEVSSKNSCSYVLA